MWLQVQPLKNEYFYCGKLISNVCGGKENFYSFYEISFTDDPRTIRFAFSTRVSKG